MNSAKDYDSDFYRATIRNGEKYSQYKCFDVCYQKYIEDSCNCSTNEFNPFYGDKRLCTVSDLTCAQNSINRYRDSKLYQDVKNCDCPVECDSIDYNLTPSIMNFPSYNLAKGLLKNADIISRFPANQTVTSAQLREKMLVVNVFFNDFSETTITEIPKTKVVELVASIGGLLGLFLGKIYSTLIFLY